MKMPRSAECFISIVEIVLRDCYTWDYGIAKSDNRKIEYSQLTSSSDDIDQLAKVLASFEEQKCGFDYTEQKPMVPYGHHPLVVHNALGIFA